jgi:hypothetical protein
MRDRKWRRRKSSSDVPPTLPPDVLAQVFRGEAINGVIPTLEERVKAAIALAPYHAPKFRRIYSIEQVLEEEQAGDVDATKRNREPIDPIRKILDEMDATFKAREDDKPRQPLRRADPSRIHIASPNVPPDDIGNRPHEFLARVARGEPIDGYLPPLKLRRAAAVASAPYYAASLRSVHFKEEEEKVEDFDWTKAAGPLEDFMRQMAEFERVEGASPADGGTGRLFPPDIHHPQ